MREIGSDFHYIDSFNNPNSKGAFSDANYYANGRQALIALILANKWQRIWIPDYFCYQIVESIKKTGITVLFYPDTPTSNDREQIANTRFEKGDVLLRMNYFGIRGFRCNSQINIPVIEDHSHDLIGDWASNSNADWCIASLRKTLPIPEGGILWSPIGQPLPAAPKQTEANINLAQLRWQAMLLKKDYLSNGLVDKKQFLEIFSKTEQQFESTELSKLDDDSMIYLQDFDIFAWYSKKVDNWKYLFNLLTSTKVMVLQGENANCFNFSLAILFDNEKIRNSVRSSLISNDIYPAILWDIPKDRPESTQEFGSRMLSIPCDARYTNEDMLWIFNILKQSLTK